MHYQLDILNKIGDILKEQKQTVSVAESVTAGHLQAAFSAVVEASKFFEGGLTAYNAGQKCRHLNVEPIHGLETDCVTADIAQTMALEANKLFLSNFGIAITGYASKMPEKGIHHLYAWFAIAEKDQMRLCKKITTKLERVEAQVDYANQVIAEFGKLLQQ